MSSFTLKQCTYFVAIAKHGGIAQAARILNVAQPSVAQALAKLEALTRLTLFDRHHARGVSLTAQGRLFLRDVQGLLDHAAQIDRQAEAIAAETAGELRLGCFMTLAAFYLPALIRSFSTENPNIQINTTELNLEQLVQGLKDYSIDAALTYDIGRGLTGLNVTRLRSITPAVILPADHPKASQESLALADLADEPYVMFNAPGSREYFSGLLETYGLTPRIGYKATSIEGVRSAVANGFGFSLVALRPPYSQTYDGKTLSVLPIREKVAPLSIVIAHGIEDVSKTIVRRFADHCKNYFRDFAD